MQKACYVSRSETLNLNTFPQVAPAPQGGFGAYDVVVFCHLRWDFVYQRPQHIISRLAHTQRVLFVEEPWRRPERPDSVLREVTDTLHVLQPNVDHIDQIADVLRDILPGGKVDTAWFYSAAFVGLLDGLAAETVVYDCMDELSLFKGASPLLIAQERKLLRLADVVFTGGRSLYEAKRDRHDHVHCFPSSVDREHFARALNDIAVPEDLARIGTPVVGYFGVIDERIDLDLLAAVAGLRPDVQFVMIGPVVKIDEQVLPKGANLHYLGMRDYQQLPNYLKGFDVAMMPFALNDATTFISPTKTLEYMAAGRPIVSTAIRDVVSAYREDVTIVDDGAAFASAIDEALSAKRPRDYTSILDQTSWDATVRRMQALLSLQTVS